MPRFLFVAGWIVIAGALIYGILTIPGYELSYSTTVSPEGKVILDKLQRSEFTLSKQAALATFIALCVGILLLARAYRKPTE